VTLLAVWIFVKRRWLAAGLTAGGFALVLAWWFTLQPSNERDWQPDVAVLAYADIEGNKVTVHNIRNCDYRTEIDFDVRHYDKTYELDRIRTADLYMVYWGSPHMAHTIISFGFEGGDYVCFSIETRKEKGENYSAVKGLFRQFELVYVAADNAIRWACGPLPARRGGLPVPAERVDRSGARTFPRLSAPHEQPAEAARVVQRAHPQLHNRHPHATRRGRSPTVELADAVERPWRLSAL
jgi:hypothetical protein